MGIIVYTFYVCYCLLVVKLLKAKIKGKKKNPKTVVDISYKCDNRGMLCLKHKEDNEGTNRKWVKGLESSLLQPPPERQTPCKHP